MLEVIPADRSDTAIRVEFFGDEIDRITEIDMLTGEIKEDIEACCDLPGLPLCCTKGDVSRRAVEDIEEELEERVKYFKSEGQASGSTENCGANEF